MTALLKGIAMLFAAAVLMLGLITFGGLLIPAHQHAVAAKEEPPVEVEVTEEKPTKKEEPKVKAKPEEVIEQTDDQFAEMVEMEAPAAPSFNINASLADIAGLLGEGGEGAGGGGVAIGDETGALGAGGSFGLGNGVNGGDSEDNGSYRPPEPTRREAPKLPAALSKQGGVIKATLFVNERGEVARVEIDPETPALAHEAAREAFLKWRFEPAERDGKKIGAKIKQRITFGKTA